MAAAKEARAAGFEHVNLDLIYGTPGETETDLDASSTRSLTAGVDHVSAYALIVEDGTAHGTQGPARRTARARRRRARRPIRTHRRTAVRRRIRLVRGIQLGRNRDSDAQCRHNLGYWDGGDWLGAGPGAHSHVGGVRWWNVKHPGRYAERVARGGLPAAGWEALTGAERYTERVMLGVRLRSGLPIAELDTAGRAACERVVADGLAVVHADRLVLTDRGRLLADGVVRDLLV